jgi:hypothetical protein
LPTTGAITALKWAKGGFSGAPLGSSAPWRQLVGDQIFMGADPAAALRVTVTSSFYH